MGGRIQMGDGEGKYTGPFHYTGDRGFEAWGFVFPSGFTVLEWDPDSVPGGEADLEGYHHSTYQSVEDMMIVCTGRFEWDGDERPRGYPRALYCCSACGERHSGDHVCPEAPAGSDWTSPSEADSSIGDSIRAIQRNIDSMDRIWWRYGLPAVIAACFLVGAFLGIVIGVYA